MLRRLRRLFHDDWCGVCAAQMEIQRRRLFAMPGMRVGHYVSHGEPEYFVKNLVAVERKAEIPVGMYACGLTAYRCPECGHRAVKAQVFLPVRDQEKPEEAFLFESGELDCLLWP